MSELTIYEAGARSPDGRYCCFKSSPEEKSIDEHLDIMKDCVPIDLELVKLEKYYQLKCTTPHIISR